MTISHVGNNDPNAHTLTLERPLKVLTPRLIALIDQGLQDVGEFGSLHLLVRDGKLRFMEVTVSVEVAEPGGKFGARKP